MCNEEINEQLVLYNDIGWNINKEFRKLRLVHCNRCGFGYPVNEPSSVILNEFYETNYRSADSPFYINLSRHRPIIGVKDIRDNRAFAQLSLARAFCKFNSEDMVLDIGPGKGGSLEVAKAIFPKPKLSVVELTEGAKDFYEKYHNAKHFQSIDEFVEDGLKAKIIVVSHTLEHLKYSTLNGFFKGLSEGLAEGGVVVVEVPNVDLRVHKDYRGPDTPHLLFFSKESLALMFEKHFFEVLFIDTCGDNYDENANIKLENGKKPLMKKHLRKYFNKLPYSLRIWARAGVRMVRRVWSLISENLFGRKYRKKLTLPHQSYGGNRTALRLVARKNNLKV